MKEIKDRYTGAPGWLGGFSFLLLIVAQVMISGVGRSSPPLGSELGRESALGFSPFVSLPLPLLLHILSLALSKHKRTQIRKKHHVTKGAETGVMYL